MSHILDAIIEQAWAITPQALQAILDLAQRVDVNADPRIFHASGQTEPEALLALGGERLEGARRAIRRGRTAILPVMGPIFPRSNLMTDYSGATSAETVAHDLRVALDDRQVDNILLNIDSPGGAVTGIGELASMIYEARNKKTITAYVMGSAASAAYWIASAAGRVVATDTAMLGSIGVVAAYLDTRQKDERAGVRSIEIVSSLSPKKRPDIATDEGRRQVQQLVDDLAAVFVSAVARNRGVEGTTVVEQFGQGDVLVAARALEAGMADSTGSLEGLIAEFAAQSRHTFMGGILMNATQKQASEQAAVTTVSLEAVRDNSPDTYKAIVELGRKEGMDEGAVAERERIAGILAIKAPGYEAFVLESALKGEQTAGSVSQAILAKQQEAREKQAQAVGADASALGAQAAMVTTTAATPAATAVESEETERLAIAERIAAGINARR